MPGERSIRQRICERALQRRSAERGIAHAVEALALVVIHLLAGAVGLAWRLDPHERVHVRETRWRRGRPLADPRAILVTPRAAMRPPVDPRGIDKRVEVGGGAGRSRPYPRPPADSSTSPGSSPPRCSPSRCERRPSASPAWWGTADVAPCHDDTSLPTVTPTVGAVNSKFACRPGSDPTEPLVARPCPALARAPCPARPRAPPRPALLVLASRGVTYDLASPHD